MADNSGPVSKKQLIMIDKINFLFVIIDLPSADMAALSVKLRALERKIKS